MFLFQNDLLLWCCTSNFFEYFYINFDLLFIWILLSFVIYLITFRSSQYCPVPSGIPYKDGYAAGVNYMNSALPSMPLQYMTIPHSSHPDPSMRFAMCSICYLPYWLFNVLISSSAKVITGRSTGYVTHLIVQSFV